jgi:hypothetical protein
MPFEDRQRLANFSRSAFGLLATVVQDQREWLPEELWEEYQRSLGDAERSLGQILTVLLQQQSPDFPDNPPIEFVEIRLTQAGLIGASLDLKLRGYDRARRRFTASPGRRALRIVLRWINVLLGSIVWALGTGELLKEFKEAIEAGVEDQKDLPTQRP